MPIRAFFRYFVNSTFQDFQNQFKNQNEEKNNSVARIDK